jgi:hypothetical protein
VPINVVYVLDNNDTSPEFVAPHSEIVTVNKPIGIYQAWNVALSMVETPYVMNLNLDDRLAPDAIETMERDLEKHDVALIGGDWKICYTQQETDKVKPCYSIEEIPFIPSHWPPTAGLPTRLGSGSGHRNTFGPATMWRLDNHISLPRYPWRFVDGEKVKIMGDAIWWNLILTHLKRKAYKMPTIIGNYHSHPLTQAEFRDNNIKREEEKTMSTAISFL